MGIWKKALPPPIEPGGRVLRHCNYKSVHCVTSPDDRVKLAVFLEQHPPNAVGHARVRIAYRTYHPEPIELTRVFVCTGGTLENYDPEQVLELLAGRTQGRAYLESVVPDAVDVVRGASGAHVSADVQAGDASMEALAKHLGVEFDAGAVTCPCCDKKQEA
jgi:hypothetical protein